MKNWKKEKEEFARRIRFITEEFLRKNREIERMVGEKNLFEEMKNTKAVEMVDTKQSIDTIGWIRMGGALHSPYPHG